MLNVNVDEILAKVNLNDISRMQPKETLSTSLTNLRKIIDKLELTQISYLFSQTITKQNLIKICNYLYENDRKTFDYLNTFKFTKNNPKYNSLTSHSNSAGYKYRNNRISMGPCTHSIII